MAIVYTTNPPKPGWYSISYKELRGHYNHFVAMKDLEFVKNLPAAIHFACAMCWFKEIGMDASIGDKGIIHELAHMLEHGGNSCDGLKVVRKSFKQLLKLD